MPSRLLCVVFHACSLLHMVAFNVLTRVDFSDQVTSLVFEVHRWPFETGLNCCRSFKSLTIWIQCYMYNLTIPTQWLIQKFDLVGPDALQNLRSCVAAIIFWLVSGADPGGAPGAQAPPWLPKMRPQHQNWGPRMAVLGRSRTGAPLIKSWIRPWVSTRVGGQASAPLDPLLPTASALFYQHYCNVKSYSWIGLSFYGLF